MSIVLKLFLCELACRAMAKPNLGVYTVRSSDRPVGPTGLSDDRTSKSEPMPTLKHSPQYTSIRCGIVSVTFVTREICRNDKI